MYNVRFSNSLKSIMECICPIGSQLGTLFEKNKNFPNSYSLQDRIHTIAAELFIHLLLEQNSHDFQAFESKVKEIISKKNSAHNLKIAFDVQLLRIKIQSCLENVPIFFGSLENFVHGLEDLLQQIPEEIPNLNLMQKLTELVASNIKAFENESKETIFELNDEITRKRLSRLNTALEKMSQRLKTTFSVDLKMETQNDVLEATLLQLFQERKNILLEIKLWISKHQKSQMTEFLNWLQKTPQQKSKESSITSFLNNLYFKEFYKTSQSW